MSLVVLTPEEIDGAPSCLHRTGPWMVQGEEEGLDAHGARVESRAEYLARYPYLRPERWEHVLAHRARQDARTWRDYPDPTWPLFW